MFNKPDIMQIVRRGVLPRILILLINIILILLITLIFDFLIFYFDFKEYNMQDKDTNIIKKYVTFYKEYFATTNENELYKRYIYDDEFYAPIENKKSKLPPVLIFGCSYVVDDSSLANVMKKYIKNPIYTRAHPGLSTQHMYFQLESDEFYKLIPRPKYIIYNFIENHVERFYVPHILSFSEYQDIFYVLSKDNKLIRKIYKNKFAKGINSIQAIKRYLFQKQLYKNNYIEQEELLKQYLLKSKEMVDKHWPGTNFILIEYQKNAEDRLKYIEEDLKNAGFIIIYRNDIAPFDDNDKKFTVNGEKDPHPNQKAWEMVVPKLLKYIS